LGSNPKLTPRHSSFLECPVLCSDLRFSQRY